MKKSRGKRATTNNRILRLTSAGAGQAPQVSKIIRARTAYESKILPLVKKIIDDVRARGDRALIEYAKKFDETKLTESTLRVSNAELERAESRVPRKQVRALETTARRLEEVELRALRRVKDLVQSAGVIAITRVWRSVLSAGCYSPGGRAAYPSSVLMTTVPAKAVGVRRVVLCSPLGKDENRRSDDLILTAARIAGVNEVYRIGGAQAIAALAYGTETVEKVDKVVGAGGPYVTFAKKLVAGDVAIDQPAGPTELVVLADESADPRLVAADLISQAEHGEESICILLSTARKLIDKVDLSIKIQLQDSARRKYAEAALRQNGFAVQVQTLADAVEFVNSFAPEHLELLTRRPEVLVKEIRNAGLILVGENTPVPAADYALGTNHVLPTNGAAASFSGLSVLTFLRTFQIARCSRSGLKQIAPTIVTLAEAEGLHAHAKAILARFDRL